MLAAPPLTRPSWVRRHRSTAVQYLVWVLTVVLVVGPLVPVVWASLWSVPLYDDGGTWTFANYRDLLSDSAWWEAVRNTVLFAVLATGAAVVAGTALAVVLNRVRLPGRRVYRTLIIAPVLLPGLPLMIGLISMYSQAGYVTSWLDRNTPMPIFWDLYSVPGMAFVATGSLIPLVYMVVSTALAAPDHTLELAARTSGAGPARALLSATVPLLRPAALNAGVIGFALSLEAVGLPLLLGTSADIDFISTYLLDNWVNTYPPRQGLVSAGAVLLLVTLTVLLLLRNRVAGDLARFTTTSGKPAAAEPVDIRGRWVLSAAIALYFVVTLVIPVIGLVLQASTAILSPFVDWWTVLTLDHFRTIGREEQFRQAVRNSLLIATVGGALATVAITAIALVAHRSQMRMRRSLGHVVLYPRAVPGVVIGMAFFWSFAVLDPGGTLRSSLWGIGIAFAVRSLALGYTAFYPALAALGEDLDRAARVSGADWLTAVRTILVRLLRPAIAVSYVLLFVAMFADYDPALFLATPDTEVVGQKMLGLWVNGVAGPVAALGLIQLAVIVLVLGVARLVFGRTAFRRTTT